MPERKRKTQVLKSIRISNADYEACKQHAKAAGMSTHAWMRQILLTAAGHINTAEQLQAVAPKMSPEEAEAQRHSFAYGNTHLDNECVTQKHVADAAENIEREAMSCALCGGPGPFFTSEETIKHTKGEYTWDNVCKWCRTSVFRRERPADRNALLSGPSQEQLEKAGYG